MDVEEVVSIIMLVILAFFLVSLFFGIMWGFLRGGKRSAIRLILSLIGCVLALLITPLASNMLLGMELPFIGEPEKYVDDRLHDSGALDDAPNGTEDLITEIVIGLATVLVNLVMFILLFFVFKWITWIIYAVLAGIFAPVKAKKRDRKEAKANGTELPKIKRHRLLGAGVGLINGFIFFAFLMIPVFGFFGAFDKIASHDVHVFASAQSMSTSTKQSDLSEFVDDMKEANDQIQDSIMGKIAGITGLNFLGRVGTNMLMEVETDHYEFNAMDVIIDGGKVAIDCVAFADEFDNDDIDERMGYWSERDWNMVQSFIDRIFGISMVESVFTGENFDLIIDYIKDEELLDDAIDEFYPNQEDKDAVYDSLRMFNAKTMANDLNKLISIAKIIFITNTAGSNLYTDIKDIIDNSNSKNYNWEYVADNISLKLGASQWQNQNSKLRQITDTLFNMHLVQGLFDDDDLENVYKAPIRYMLDDIDTDEINISKKSGQQWIQGDSSVSAGSAEFIYNLLSVAGATAGMFNDDDIIVAIASMDDEEVGSLIYLLDILTNSDGVGGAFRSYVIDNLPSNFANTGIDPVDNLMNDILGTLNGDEHIDWDTMIRALHQLAQLIVEYNLTDFDDLDYFDILDLFQNGGFNALIEIIGGSELVTDFLFDLIDELFDEFSNGAITFDIDEDDREEVLEVLGDVLGIVADMVDIFDGDTEVEDMEDILKVLGILDDNGDPNEDNALLKLLDVAEHSTIEVDLGQLLNIDDQAELDEFGDMLDNIFGPGSNNANRFKSFFGL